MTEYSAVLDAAFAEQPENPTSWLGTEIVGQVTFGGKIFKEYGPNGKLVDLALDDFVLPSTTLAQFSRPKEIVKTKLLGAPGTTKELFSYGDWQIEMIIRCIKDPGRTSDIEASEQLKKLLKYDRVLGSIDVYGAAFSNHNIEQIVIERIEELTKKGNPETIDVRIRAVSDEVNPWLKQ